MEFLLKTQKPLGCRLYFKSSSDDVSYDLDLVSGGKNTIKAPLCEQKDVWGKYDKPLDKLSFSTGIIPRAFGVRRTIRNICFRRN